MRKYKTRSRVIIKLIIHKEDGKWKILDIAHQMSRQNMLCGVQSAEFEKKMIEFIDAELIFKLSKLKSNIFKKNSQSKEEFHR